jgi:hypothetical protein
MSFRSVCCCLLLLLLPLLLLLLQVGQVVEALVLKYVALTHEELEEWRDDPEGYIRWGGGERGAGGGFRVELSRPTQPSSSKTTRRKSGLSSGGSCRTTGAAAFCLAPP